MFKIAIIMAAGKGTRMFPVSDYVPKPLIKIHNIPLIDHCINKLRKNGIDKIYVTYGYKSNLLISHIEKKVDGLFNTIDEDNAYFLTNTIIKNINELIVIMPCDILMTYRFNKIWDECLKKGNNKSYILPVKYREGMHADFLKYEVNSKITDIGRTFKTDKCASGLQILNPYRVNLELKKEVNNWYDVWKILIKKNSLFMLDYIAEKWETYDTLEQLLITKINE